MSQLQKVSIESFTLESGVSLHNVDIAYHAYGELNAEKSNVIFICHGLTASSDAANWWPGMIGPGLAFDTDKYCVICANTLGSVYGTTGPRSINTKTNESYGLAFPFFTVRDTAKLFHIFLTAIGIHKLKVLVGASFGGYQALELALDNIVVEKLLLLVTSSEESTWGRAIHTTQRMAIEADSTFRNNDDTAGTEGLKAARAIGMLSYRGNDGLTLAQKEVSKSVLKNFKVESYLRYQGEKLSQRFHAHAYYTLSECMDSHDISRNRRLSTEKLLNSIEAKTAVIGISTDILNPPIHQQFLAQHIPKAKYHEVASDFGHDGFLIEHEKISRIVRSFLGRT